MGMKRILLIKPRIGHRGMERYVDSGRMEPLQMGILAAMAKSRFRVGFLDDRIDDIDISDRPDAVLMTVEAFTARRAYALADAFRARGVKVILGGMHPTLLPEEASLHADSVYTGDAEAGFPSLLDDLDSGRLASRYHGEPDLVQPGFRPDRSIFRGKGYLPVSLLQFGRGCPNGCRFCATSKFFSATCHYRPIDEVVEEIERDCGRVLFFVDDNFAADPEYASRLVERLIPLRRLWVTQLTVGVAHDRAFLRLLRKSGCLGFVVGFESILPDSLEWMAKPDRLAGSGVPERPWAAEIRAFREHDLNLWAAFTIGHDHDSPESLELTLDFAKRNAFSFAAFNILTPYPGTPLYDAMRDEGRLLFGGKWWDHPDYRFNDAVFLPRNFSPRGLTAAGWRMRREFNSTMSALRRVAAFRSGGWRFLMLASYLSYIRIFRAEIRKKHGLALGSGEGRA